MKDFKFGYREVIPDQTVAEKWKEIILNTGGTQSILQDVKVAERAGGYCYQDSSKYYTRNRFIYWRIYHDILELVEQSMDVNLIDARVRYRFTDTPILDGITIHEINGQVIILIPTVCSVHCLTFSHPERIHKQHNVFGASHPDLTVPSIFAEASVLQAKDPSTYHVVNNIGSVLPHAAASTFNRADNEATFILAYNTITILLIRMVLNSTQCYTTELKQDSIVPRFLSGIAGAFRSGKSTDGQVAVSLLLHCIQSETYALVLGRDGHLRVWSCSKSACVRSVDVLGDTADSQSQLTQGSQNHILRKSTDSDEENLLIGIFLCFSNACQFQIFKAGFEDGMFVFLRLCTLYAPEYDLVDYTLDSQRLWVVWRGSQGDCSVTNSYLLESGQTALWMPSVLEPAPPRDYIPADSNLDPRQAYSDYIFYPGRFPFFVIIRALSIYKKSAMLTDVSISPTLLKQRVCMAIEAEIQAEVMEYELSDDDYLEISNRCWSRFYSCCAQYNATGARPLGILLLPPVSGLILIRKATISIMRPMEILEHLILCGSHTTVEQLLSSHMVSNDPVVCKDLLQLISILVSIEQCLTDEIKANIEKELRFFRPPDQIIAELVEELISSGNDSTISAAVIWELCRKASGITDLYQAIHFLLQILRLDKYYVYNEDSDDENGPYLRKMSAMIDHMYSSSLGASVVTESVHQMAIIRFSICRNLLFLQHILLEGRQQDWDILEAIRSVCMPDTVVFTQAYFTIVWLSETIASPITMLESSQQKLSCLQLAPVITSSRALSQRYTTLPELFILGDGGRRAHQQLANLQSDLNEIPYWHNSLLTYAGIISKLIWPVSGTLTLGEWLLSSGQHLILQQYVRQLSPWCEWNNCSRQFLLAVAFLANGERRKALDLFQLAANGIYTDKFLIEKIINLSGEENTETKALTEYYLKVINLFEQYDAYDCAIKMAETAISRIDDENETHLATLHSIIFVHHLNLDHYEQAYHALDANPDRNRRKDCLRQLVGTLLEKKQLDTLIKFPYVGMISEFENIVESRARAMNLQENYVYDFLYSFHMIKGNFRRAGTVMYEQGLVLSQINQEWALERQVKSYLSCLNCLYLVEKPFQFIVRPRAFVDEQPVVEIAENVEIPGVGPLKIELTDEIRKRLQNTFLTISEFQNDDGAEKIELKRDIEVLNIEDIKKELEHVTARLTLSKLSPQFQISCYSTPNELVGLLLNVGLFEAAANLCTTFGLSYDTVFEALTTACLRLNRNQSPESSAWLIKNSVADLALGETSAAKVGWMFLKEMLMKYEEDNLTVLHKVVARRIIAFNGYLPYWLTASYKVRNAGELIRLYNSSGRILEACRICVDYVDAALGKGKELFGLKNPILPNAPPLCLPTFTFFHILQRLKRLSEANEKYRVYYQHLHNVLKKYATTARRISADYERIQWQKATARASTSSSVEAY